MGLEQQLQFDISRCSSCPLGANRTFFSPLLSNHVDTVLLLEAPNQSVCQEGNPWRGSGMPFLTRALQHAAGMDLSRFHVTFVSKCLPKVDGMVPPRRQKRDWASVCASQYLTQELRALAPKQIFIFGEMAIRVCFPNLETKWEDLLFQTKTMEPLGIEAHFFDQPTRLQKLGLSGEEGEALLSKLNQQLGGELSPPDQDQNLDLFDLL